jgi:hypothetical protein
MRRPAGMLASERKTGRSSRRASRKELREGEYGLPLATGTEVAGKGLGQERLIRLNPEAEKKTRLLVCGTEEEMAIDQN